MPQDSSTGYAFNRTRQAFIASQLCVADTHWKRFRGLLGMDREQFGAGQGLWIIPCQGVHTLGMRFAIDVVYLDAENRVVHIEENVKPWRITPVRLEAATVLELPSHTVWDTGTVLNDQIEIRMSKDGVVAA
ncbi:MAG TPA: DUF192 domain-containing protein [Terriglobales bacterium]|jgi:hypothetical protein|nr:DUF192 domain-containing protein [Terriglobales bacterium]